MSYCFYRKSDGGILFCCDTFLEEARRKRTVLSDADFVEVNEKVSSANYYVDVGSGEVAERSKDYASVSVSTGEAVLSDLPEGTKVVWGSTFELSQGDMTIEADEPGLYTLNLYPPVPYKQKTIEIDIP